MLDAPLPCMPPRTAPLPRAAHAPVADRARRTRHARAERVVGREARLALDLGAHALAAHAAQQVPALLGDGAHTLHRLLQLHVSHCQLHARAAGLGSGLGFVLGFLSGGRRAGDEAVHASRWSRIRAHSAVPDRRAAGDGSRGGPALGMHAAGGLGQVILSHLWNPLQAG